ncbi:MAG: putative metalloprotease CJM1_0395 family protein [Spirochaeta sp.]|jgi:hypothetical protein|nr:putative metalloprotease CJM1_0395 family protein [Spirochaeta sp.]
MRVVYDFGVGSASPHRTPTPAGTSANHHAAQGTASAPRKESVIVISLGSDDQAIRRSSQDYEVVLSPEARLRDGEVRHHERSHARTLGPYATTPVMYDTARGPEGEVVATGGRIGVDLDPVPGDPSATLKKARVVLNAAHAPGSPSAADMRVAAEAYRLAQQAQDEIDGRSASRVAELRPEE